ncbi:unnamed protein product, partial [Prorocentrum cordatum]
MDRKRLRGKQPRGDGGPELAPRASPANLIGPPLADPAVPTLAPVALSEWFAAVLKRAPPACHPPSPQCVLRGLAAGGAVDGSDFSGLGVQELKDVWPCLHGLRDEFVAALSTVPARAAVGQPAAQTEARAQRGAPAPAASKVPPAGGPAHAEDEAPATGHAAETGEAALAALGFLAAARLRRELVGPGEMADAVQTLGRVTPEEFQLAWEKRHGGIPGNPRERAAQIGPEMAGFMATQELLRRELLAWHRSAYKYASPVRLWGQVARNLGVDAWPPSEPVLGAFAFAVQNGASLMTYCTQVRTVLRLLHMPLGCLEDTSCLARGASKAAVATRRFRARASARQTRSLAQHVREVLGDPETADAFVVARQFCFRFASELVPLQADGPHSKVVLSTVDGLPTASVHLHRRKTYTETT